MEKEQNNQFNLTQNVDIKYRENFETGHIYLDRDKSDWDKCPNEDSLRNLREYQDKEAAHYNFKIVPDEDIKIDTEALERLSKEFFKDVLLKVKRTYDPMDKISILEVFIKKILESQSVNEVVLANPFNPETDESTYETGDNWLGRTIEDAYKAFHDQDPDFLWHESPWIAYIYPWNKRNRSRYTIYYHDWEYYENNLPTKICVRLGIVDDTVKFTSQTFKIFRDCAQSFLLPETDWLKLGNIGNPKFVIQLVKLILKVPKIWQFSAKYPGFHKLKQGDAKG